jgi:hypothetical protein
MIVSPILAENPLTAVEAELGSYRWSEMSFCSNPRCASIFRPPVCCGERASISRFLCQGKVRRWKRHEPIKVQLEVGHQASALSPLQTWAEGKLGILLAECDHIMEDGVISGYESGGS